MTSHQKGRAITAERDRSQAAPVAVGSSKKPAKPKMKLWQPAAFPSFATHDDWQRFQPMLSLYAARPRTPTEQQRYRLPLLCCAVLDKDGVPCGRRLGSAQLKTSMQYRYFNNVCAEEGHSTAVAPFIEDVVVEMILERLDAAA